jgi:predicted transcriptional regulator
MEVKETLLIFIEIIIQSQDAGLRQTSAVVIRRWFFDLIKKQENVIVEQIKIYLLQALKNEQVRTIRKAIANLVLEIAKNNEENKWMELLQYIDE